MKIDERGGIIYREWHAPSVKAVLLLVHGLGAHTGRWEFCADYFLNKNISSCAIELKGFGKTPGLKGHVDSFDTYLADIKKLLEIIKEKNKGKKVFLTGESLGGLISILTVEDNPDLFDGLICISPAFSNRLKVKILEYVKIFSSLLYNPKKQFSMPFNAQMCTRDVEYQKVMEADEREHRLASSRLLFNTLLAQPKSFKYSNRIKIPVLFLLAGEDKLVNPDAAKNFFKGLKTEDKELIEYPGMYHALSIELGREKVFKDAFLWLEKRL